LWHNKCHKREPRKEDFVGDAGLVFEVKKNDWTQTRFVDGPAPDLGPGQVLFRVDRFALTSNNVSYALSGDMLGYWKFFPADDGWGRIPVMGFADVIRSTHSGVAEGTRCFGFYPMGRHLVIEPGAASAAQIVDAAPHRAGLAPVYAQYLPTTGDPVYAPAREDQILLMRGLFMTSFLADDFLAEQGYRGARAVLISSASSKTSIALAFQVKQTGRARAIGLTSARNAPFVRSLGFYDEVVLYDEIGSLAVEPAVFVDMAGDGAVTTAVHRRFGDALAYDCTIGATHWSADRDTGALPGPKPEFFFAPGQIAKRTKDWGPQGVAERIGSAWAKFCDASDAWLRVERSAGREALERVYADVVAGRSDPAVGHVLSL
jgi:NADPH:quinone reductase-like Zn-dependent oxidoreductase